MWQTLLWETPATYIPKIGIKCKAIPVETNFRFEKVVTSENPSELFQNIPVESLPCAVKTASDELNLIGISAAVSEGKAEATVFKWYQDYPFKLGPHLKNFATSEKHDNEDKAMDQLKT